MAEDKRILREYIYDANLTTSTRLKPYNALSDPALYDYFHAPGIRKHLKHIGLIDGTGHRISDSEWNKQCKALERREKHQKEAEQKFMMQKYIELSAKAVRQKPPPKQPKSFVDIYLPKHQAISFKKEYGLPLHPVLSLSSESMTARNNKSKNITSPYDSNSSSASYLAESDSTYYRPRPKTSYHPPSSSKSHSRATTARAKTPSASSSAKKAPSAKTKPTTAPALNGKAAGKHLSDNSVATASLSTALRPHTSGTSSGSSSKSGSKKSVRIADTESDEEDLMISPTSGRPKTAKILDRQVSWTLTETPVAPVSESSSRPWSAQNQVDEDDEESHAVPSNFLSKQHNVSVDELRSGSRQQHSSKESSLDFGANEIPVLRVDPISSSSDNDTPAQSSDKSLDVSPVNDKHSTSSLIVHETSTESQDLSSASANVDAPYVLLGSKEDIKQAKIMSEMEAFRAASVASLSGKTISKTSLVVNEVPVASVAQDPVPSAINIPEPAQVAVSTGSSTAINAKAPSEQALNKESPTDKSDGLALTVAEPAASSKTASLAAINQEPSSTAPVAEVETVNPVIEPAVSNQKLHSSQNALDKSNSRSGSRSILKSFGSFRSLKKAKVSEKGSAANINDKRTESSMELQHKPTTAEDPVASDSPTSPSLPNVEASSPIEAPASASYSALYSNPVESPVTGSVDIQNAASEHVLASESAKEHSASTDKLTKASSISAFFKKRFKSTDKALYSSPVETPINASLEFAKQPQSPTVVSPAADASPESPIFTAPLPPPSLEPTLHASQSAIVENTNSTPVTSEAPVEAPVEQPPVSVSEAPVEAPIEQPPVSVSAAPVEQKTPVVELPVVAPVEQTIEQVTTEIPKLTQESIKANSQPIIQSSPEPVSYGSDIGLYADAVDSPVNASVDIANATSETILPSTNEEEDEELKKKKLEQNETSKSTSSFKNFFFKKRVQSTDKGLYASPVETPISNSRNLGSTTIKAAPTQSPAPSSLEQPQSQPQPQQQQEQSSLQKSNSQPLKSALKVSEDSKETKIRDRFAKLGSDNHLAKSADSKKVKFGSFIWESKKDKEMLGSEKPQSKSASALVKTGNNNIIATNVVNDDTQNHTVTA